MQIITAAHPRGQAVLASDAAHYYRNFQERIPFNTLHDIPGTYHAFQRLYDLASSPDLILPGHDPLVLEKLKKIDMERRPTRVPRLLGNLAATSS